MDSPAVEVLGAYGTMKFSPHKLSSIKKVIWLKNLFFKKAASFQKQLDKVTDMQLEPQV